MSILAEIQNRCNENSPQLHLFEASPKNLRARLVPNKQRRTLYVSTEIQRFLDSQHPLAVETRADLERFILGELIVVALEKDHKQCRMARLEEAHEEVWEIRVYDADPQLRLFGRFADRDTFVALMGPIERGDISDEDFEEIKYHCKSDWERLFGFLNRPVVGGDIHDYISDRVRVV